MNHDAFMGFTITSGSSYLVLWDNHSRLRISRDSSSSGGSNSTTTVTRITM